MLGIPPERFDCMKKTLLFLLCAFLVLSESACSKITPTTQNPKDTYIQAVTLTEDELKLVTLLQCGEFGISRFSVSDSKKLEIIFDVFESGTLIDTETFDAGTFTVTDGKIAVVPAQKNTNYFTINMTDGNGNNIGWWLEKDYDTDGMVYSGLFNSTIKTAVKDSDTYVLFARFFSDSQSMTVLPDAMYNPEQLKQFNYTYIISCRFTTTT